MLIINTGGTFNKRYNPLNGELFVPSDDRAVEAVLERFADSFTVEGIIYKDSLEMDENDRELLAQKVVESKEKEIVIVHGTDTMDLSADKLASLGPEKVIVLTGAMVPFSIDPVEAAANLAMAIGYARNAPSGVHIVIQGISGPFDRVKKNRTAGRFEYV
jgi:L-asparaginase